RYRRTHSYFYSLSWGIYAILKRTRNWVLFLLEWSTLSCYHLFKASGSPLNCSCNIYHIIFKVTEALHDGGIGAWLLTESRSTCNSGSSRSRIRSRPDKESPLWCHERQAMLLPKRIK
ncbi:hypothetical protein AX14_007314, partial [Amanita brunnescens Koide BX004]